MKTTREISPLEEYDNGNPALTSECLGPPTRPQDVADMSPSAVAYWIATKGGLLEFNIADVGAWKLAFDMLLEMIVAGRVEVWGRRFGNGLHEKIDGLVFAGVLVDYPCQYYSDIVFGDDPYLECYGVLDDQHSRNGDDKLFSRWCQLEWSHLRIKASDVAQVWPVAQARNRRGRKIKYETPIRDLVFELMNYNGDLAPEDDAWSCQGDVEKAVRENLSQKHIEPAPSTVRSWVRKSIEEWRAMKTRQN